MCVTLPQAKRSEVSPPERELSNNCCFQEPQNKQPLRILFYFSWEIAPNVGGTERITTTISQGLHRIYGAECYSAYSQARLSDVEKTPFCDKIKLGRKNREKELHDFIERHHIDIVVVQGAFGLVPVLRKAVKSLHDVRIVFAHHYAPGWEIHRVPAHELIYNIRHGNEKWKKIIKFLFNPFFRCRHIYETQRGYHKAYELADRVVLLSSHFKRGFMDFGRIGNDEKFTFIPNALSFLEFLPQEEIKDKENVVIVVSRLDETHKRISLALAIWQKVMKDEMLKRTWRLQIVGEGDMWLPQYRRFVEVNRLENVSFEGRQDPTPYYKKAKLFMMTSCSEGWGLTLTESQQMGVVPLAFDSYASLHDIITDGENGYIISDNDIDAYAEKMVHLMRAPDILADMAEKAIVSSRRFESRKVCAQWWDLLRSLVPYKDL